MDAYNRLHLVSLYSRKISKKKNNDKIYNKEFFFYCRFIEIIELLLKSQYSFNNRL